MGLSPAQFVVTRVPLSERNWWFPGRNSPEFHQKVSKVKHIAPGGLLPAGPKTNPASHMASCGIGGMWIGYDRVGCGLFCCSSQLRELGRIQNGGIIVMLPAAVGFVSTCVDLAVFGGTLVRPLLVFSYP